VSQASPTVVVSRNLSQQPLTVSPILGVGVGGAVVRRGYDVDEDEWILEPVSNGFDSSEAVSIAKRK
jgi:hypothetical protein